MEVLAASDSSKFEVLKKPDNKETFCIGPREMGQRYPETPQKFSKNVK